VKRDRGHRTKANLRPSAYHCSDLQQPLPAWRRRLVVAGSRFTGGVLLALGYRVRYHGLDNIRRGRELRAIVLFNHMAFVSAPAPVYSWGAT